MAPRRALPWPPLPVLLAAALLQLGADDAAWAGSVHDTAITCAAGVPKLQSSGQAACEAQVAVLNQALEACRAGAGVVACNSAGVLTVGASACAQAKSDINAAVREFRGPEGEAEDIACAFGEFLVDESGCPAAAATLTAMTRAFAGGGFQSCSVTTPTTTQTTTTASTTPTTTATTTTATTSATTTQTTTPHTAGLGCITLSNNHFLGGASCDVDALYLTR